MKNPVWFDTTVSHKAIYVGPSRMPVALCKLAFREFWPPDGCADLRDICRRNWAEVECIQCNAFDPEVEKLEAPLHGAICGDCAKKKKLRWPKGHCATFSVMQCDFCLQEKSICSVRDWLKAGEKEIPLGSWD